MTESEKQEILRNFSVVIDYLAQQLKTEETNVIQNTLLYNLTSSSFDGLSIPAMPFPFEAPSTIAEQGTWLNHLSQTAEYVRSTAAAELTDDGIRNFTRALQ